MSATIAVRSYFFKPAEESCVFAGSEAVSEELPAGSAGGDGVNTLANLTTSNKTGTFMLCVILYMGPNYQDGESRCLYYLAWSIARLLARVVR